MKLSNKKIVSNYWDSVRGNYSNLWTGGSKPWMSRQEANFILTNTKSIDRNEASCLDVGSGNGRIIEILLASGFSKIFSVDVSKEMVEYLREKFNEEQRIKKISKIETISAIQGKYDLITSIRVLKYNSDWRDGLKHLVDRLKPNGYLIFSIPNSASINVFAKCPIKMYRANISELRKLFAHLPVEVVSIKTLFRLPDILYWSKFLAKIRFVSFIENLLSKIFPDVFAGKLFFVAIRKKNNLQKNAQRV